MPIERRTRAPAPSDCSMARKACLICRGTVMLAGFAGAKKVGGTRGGPKKGFLPVTLDAARREGESVVLCPLKKKASRVVLCRKVDS